MRSFLQKAPVLRGITLKAVTLIELLLVISILAVLSAISYPNFKKTFSGLQLNSFSSGLQEFMNYLRQRSIVEGKVIYLSVDNDKKEYWAQLRLAEARIKTYHIPDGINVEVTKPFDPGSAKIGFYPDGQIDKAAIKIVDSDNQSIKLTTIGVFGGVKVEPPE